MSSIKISKENIEILNAFHGGKRIERRWKLETGDEWFPAAGDTWDFEFYEYRIAEPVPHPPDALVWWVRTANRAFHSTPKIMNDGSGTTLGTWRQMHDAGCTWSPDRKRWFNFYGERQQ